MRLPNSEPQYSTPVFFVQAPSANNLIATPRPKNRGRIQRLTHAPLCLYPPLENGAFCANGGQDRPGDATICFFLRPSSNPTQCRI